MKILSWDIETSPIIATTWGIWDQNIGTDSILEDWKIICASWKWLHESEPEAVTWKKTQNKEISPFLGYDDTPVIKKLHSVLSQADVIVAQNGDNFDWKKFQTRCFILGLPPLKKIPSVDTLKTARKEFKFTSNKLDYISKSLGHEGKLPTTKGLWMRVIQGDKASLKEMVDYCKVDVIELEKVYLKMLPYIRNHPDQSKFHGDLCCRGCGSKRLSKRGAKLRAGGKRVQSYQCKECGGWTSSTLSPPTTAGI